VNVKTALLKRKNFAVGVFLFFTLLPV